MNTDLQSMVEDLKSLGEDACVSYQLRNQYCDICNVGFDVKRMMYHPDHEAITIDTEADCIRVEKPLAVEFENCTSKTDKEAGMEEEVYRLIYSEEDMDFVPVTKGFTVSFLIQRPHTEEDDF